MKKCLICFSAILCIMTLCSCASKENSTENKTAGVGQMMYYNGMEAPEEKDRFTAEITLEDVVRGETAQDIFAAAGRYEDALEMLDISDDGELMAARFTFTLTNAQENADTDIGARETDLFKLVSENGTNYDDFQQRKYIKGNLFMTAEVGKTQTGVLFYMVDKADENPSIVFQPQVGEGIRFKTNLNWEDREKVIKPLLVSNWLGADGKPSDYAGTFYTPLPVGEFGYMKCGSGGLGDYEIEIKVNDVLRGDAAEEQLDHLDVYAFRENILPERQEYLLIPLTVNLPSANLPDGDLFTIDSVNFTFINGKDGKAYDYDRFVSLRPYDLCGIAPGGTATGWVGAIVDKDDSAPMMYYVNDDKWMYFKLDKAYGLPDGFSSYQSPIRDTEQEKGNWNNPHDMGETVYLNDSPSFTGSICVQEAYKGALAEKFISPLYDYTPGRNMELIVLKTAVHLKGTDGDPIPQSAAAGYTILTGQGGEVVAEKLPAEALKTEEKDGYTAFLIPKGNDNLVLTYGDSYTGFDNHAWITLRFSD